MGLFAYGLGFNKSIVTSCSTEMGRRKKNRGYYGQSRRKKEESGSLRAKERICNRNSLSSNKSRSAVCYRRTRAFPCLKNMSGWSLLHYMAFDFYSLEYFYEGERLASLLDSIKRGIDSAKLLDEGSLPEKVWFKKQFSIGVNDVTRVLERMAPTSETGNSHEHHNVICGNRKVPLDKLQAILLASDCNPRWLMKHLPSLASSRKVPIIYVKDGKRGSLHLGELVKLKTAIAIGVKVRGNAINQNVEEIICGNKLNHEPEYLKVNEVPAEPSK